MKTRTSGAKALTGRGSYGTAEAVPFVRACTLLFARGAVRPTQRVRSWPSPRLAGSVIVDFLKPSVIILAYNSVDTLGATLEQAQQVSDDLYVIDSFSTDDTVAPAGNTEPRSYSMRSRTTAHRETGPSITWRLVIPGNCTWMPMSG